MGSGSGSAGNPERTAQAGRHRRTAAATTWTPPITPSTQHVPAHAREPIDPPASGEFTEPAEEPSGDPLADTGPHGLYGFNLGSIPASVTPPRSWRRAAWFMIFASAAALAGLLVMTASLVQPTEVADQITNLPDLPTGPRIGMPTSQANPPARSARAGQDRPRESAPSYLAGGPEVDPVAMASQLTGPALTTDPGSDPASSGGGTTPPPTDSTPLTVVTGSGPPGTDPGTLAARTQTFFREVTTNVSAAAELTAGTVRDDAVALIEQRYGGVATIQVQSIQLDPNSGVTVSLLRITGRDGTTSTEQATLRFTLGTDPKIQNPGG